MNAAGPVQIAIAPTETAATRSPATMSGTRAVRSATCPKIGSATSRAAGQAAITIPSSATATPCWVK